MSTQEACTCYYFDCNELKTETGKHYGITGWSMDEIIKTNNDVEVITKTIPFQIKPGIGIDRQFVFVIKSTVVEGWIIDGIEVGRIENYFPAYETWDGWEKVYNSYYTNLRGKRSSVPEITEGTKLLRAGQVQKEGLIKWINDKFPECVKEFEFEF